MPDKKVSQQTEHISTVLGADLLPMVSNTAGTPINNKVQVKNFLSQISIDLPQTTFSALKITANITANANAAVLTAGEFAMVANSSIGAVIKDRYGLVVKNIIQNGTSNVIGQMAAAMFTLDTGNSNCVAANTYGLIINHALDANVAAARLVAPRAYIAVTEDAGTNAAARTSYLMELGALSKSISADTANTNTSVIFSKTGDLVATHTLKLRINGQDVWILASNTGPA